eukprot:949349-Amphidinium_carterae.1
MASRARGVNTLSLVKQCLAPLFAQCIRQQDCKKKNAFPAASKLKCILAHPHDVALQGFGGFV